MKVEFSKLLKVLLPSFMAVACNAQHPSMKLFNTLCLQVARWYANSKEHEAPDLVVLLDTLMECMASVQNTTLRAYSATVLAEFVKWSIKVKSQKELMENYFSIRSAIKRIESFATQSNLFRRKAALLALKSVLPYIREESFLREKYIMSILFTTL